MPSIEVTPEQAERLRAVREELAADVVGKYGHVRVQDAIEYLLDEHDGATGDGATGDDATGDDTVGTTEPAAVGADVSDDAGDDAADDRQAATATVTTADAGEQLDAADDTADEADSGGASDDAMLDAMMNLLDTHADKWGEASSGDERYEVTLPDGGVERVRTKDDVRALLFEHYR
jgi:hypothetical protein